MVRERGRMVIGNVGVSSGREKDEGNKGEISGREKVWLVGER